MTARERENQLSKIKQFFRMYKPGSVSSSRHDLPISPELERELRPETPVTQRCKALRDFGEQVMSSRLEPDAVQSLWGLTKDLLVGNKLMEQRQCALAFYCKLIQGQYDSLGMMRAQFYRVIESHSEPEDISYRLEMLKLLTETGKNIQHFEKEIGPFLLEWIKPIHEAGLIDSLLELIVNLIKYNAASLEPKFLVGVVSYIFDMTCNKQETNTILLCLSVLDCFICYAIIPNESLTLFIIILCRMVNQYCQHCWKIMKNLFGTALGHATLLTMCNILNNPSFHQDAALLRGAVFHTNMGLWGISVVPILNCSPSLVLTSFLNALKSRHVIVAYEVILSMNRLIQKSGNELNEPTWDIICDIMTEISHNLAIHRLPADHTVVTHFHETLNMVETLLQQGTMNADPEKVYAMIEHVSAQRPEASVRQLIDYRASKISATRSEWLKQLCQFMDRFYRVKNSNVRIYALQALERIMTANRAAYEDEILDRIVIVHLGTVPLEKDAEVRKAVARTLIEFTIHCETKRCMELLEIVEKLLHRPYDENQVVRSEQEAEDIILLVDGLIRLFIVKLYRLPSLHAIRVYSMLIGLLELHYQRPHVLANVTTIRYRIFSWMMKARANGSFHIGYPDPEDGNKVRFSHYLGIEGPYQHQSLQPQPYLSSQSTSQLNLTTTGGSEAGSKAMDRIPATNLTTISIKRGCQVIVLCLKEEKDWEVIQLVLTELPSVMQNKALIQGNDVDSLARTLYRMYTDKMQLEKLQLPANMVPKMSDYMELILPALSSLAMYHQHLDFNTQKNIIDALKQGLISRRPHECIRMLTILLLEMPEQLMPKMADLLLELSKMTGTKMVALPVLEFLSTLILVPSFRFGNFTMRTYMCVMAMSLPFTNPFRYDHYTVSLAHYVVAAWFIKCKLPLRHQLVKFIVQGLESYVHVPFQDGSRAFSQLPAQKVYSISPLNDDMYRFHCELADTCVDFMVRHTFSPCSGISKRLPSAEFLLSGGQSMTWLVGHDLITITTSGCSGVTFRNGLCDRCHQYCQSAASASGTAVEPFFSSASSGKDSGLSGIGLGADGGSAGTGKSLYPTDNGVPMTPAPASTSNKRYTKASLQHSSANESDSTDLTTTSSTSSSTAVTPFPTAPHSAHGPAAAGGLSGTVPVTGSSRFIFRQGSQEGYSSGSLEALSRRDSNADLADPTIGPGMGGIGSGGGELQLQRTSSLVAPRAPPGLMATIGNRLILPQQLSNSLAGGSSSSSGIGFDKPVQPCACVCTGWAEVCVRRPTGFTSWITRIQTQVSHDILGGDVALQDLTSLFSPSVGGGVVGTDYLTAAAGGHQPYSTDGITPFGSSADIPSVTMADRPAAGVGGPSEAETQPSNLQGSAELVNTVPANVTVQHPRAKVSISDEVFEMAKKGESKKKPSVEEEHEQSEDEELKNVLSGGVEGTSPEMRTKWNNQFLSKAKENVVQDASAGMASAAGAGDAGSAVVTTVTGMAQNTEGTVMEKKKSTYGKGVSCEAIPEEIAGSTPPPPTALRMQSNLPEAPTVAPPTVRGTVTAKHQAEFSANKATAITTSLPESNTLDPTTASMVAPRKQHSADDATLATRSLTDAGAAASNETISSTVSNASNQMIAPIAMHPITQTSSSSALSLKLPMEKVTSKPPQSPVPLSPRLIARNTTNLKQSSSGTASPSFPAMGGSGIGGGLLGMGGGSNDNDNLPRGRSKTISTVREHYSRDGSKWSAANVSRMRNEHINRTVVSPSFVFLQLYHHGQFGSECPLLMDKDPEKAIALLDLIPPFEMHKIGVLYVGPGQAGNETEILKNRYGSLRYAEFLSSLGTLVAIKDAKEKNIFIDLESNGKDGAFTYIYQDDIVQLTFHVATLMPNKRQDPHCNEKKKHIGNDFVTIVYNESGEEYDLKTIRGQYNYACVIVEPIELNSNRVFIRSKDDIAQHVTRDTKIVSDHTAPLLARQMALHANVSHRQDSSSCLS
uniref:Rap-GAP domain-containing protein n=1 Tax=Anopheles culicifacies TaxID=139723 RepID=A0A182MSN4_9DIPT